MKASGKLLVIIAVLLTIPAALLNAQEETPEPGSGGLITVSGWITTEADEEAPEEPVYTVLVELEDGAAILEVGTGADVVYTRQDDGTYAGAPLVPTDSYELEASLAIVDENTRQINSITTSRAFTSERSLLLERSDVNFSIWVEGDRNLTEFSMFAECMGLMDAIPPRIFAVADPIVPVRLDEDAGILWIGWWQLEGSGTYTREIEEPFGQFTRVTTETAIVSDDLIQYSYHSIGDGRDDCEVSYTSEYTPFDGDLDTLLMRAVELGML